MMRRPLSAVLALVCLAVSAGAASFQPPTASRTLYRTDQQERYYAPTTGRTWVSGTFGCVRSSGWQMHEGLDVLSIQRDKSGEPTDPVVATMSGRVAYINRKPSLSNYGNYVILQHNADGLEVYSVYAHLSQMRSGLAVGQSLQAGEAFATMGRTSNTRERIAKERAHVHFELNFFATDRFVPWYRKNYPGQRNDHGQWNGQNMLGVDPRAVLLTSAKEGAKFNFRVWVQNQTELCRVFVRKTDFSWLRRYPALVQKNPVAEKQGIVGYEIALTFNGMPCRLIPRAASEVKTKSKYSVISVNASEYERCPCRKLVVRRGKGWDLGSNGTKLLELLTY